MVTRKHFLQQSLTLAIAGGLGAFSSSARASSFAPLTVQDIIDQIIKDIPGAPFKQTVDILKSGAGNTVVTGVVTTMFATMDVIKAAIARNANFIIAHEPTYYNHEDSLTWVPSNEVLAEKTALLKKHNIVIWRFHDYAHALSPDIVGLGVLRKTNWLQHYQKGEWMFMIPQAPLKEVCEHLKQSLGIRMLKVIGNAEQACQSVVLIPGAAGGQLHITAVEKYDPDLLIVGEVHEWETAEYIRDRRAQGKNTALIILGHSVSEEPGMEELAGRLRTMLPQLPVSHLPSGDPFRWV